MIGFLLSALLVTGWLGVGVALVAMPVVAVRRYEPIDATDLWVVRIFCALLVGAGLGMLLLFGAVVTGDISLAGAVKDGCYHVYRVGSGKSSHTEYDPIPCPEWVR